MDTAGAKHMSLYGYHRRTTPELERLADQSTLYTRCFAPGCWTPPSHASIFTGLPPSQHGVDGDNLILDSNYQHIVSILKQVGYRTYGISCNGLVTPIFGICRKFDFFQNPGDTNANMWESKAKNDPQVQELYKKLCRSQDRFTKLRYILEHILLHKDLAIIPTMSKRILLRQLGLNIKYRSAPYTKRSFSTALKHIREHLHYFPDNPFFCFVNVIENHMFYNPPKNSRRFSRPTDKQTFFTQNFYRDDFAKLIQKLLPAWQNLYDDTIVFLDSIIGKFVAQLKTLGVLDNTVYIVTSDHGEHLGEKGFYAHLSSLYNELIWVPLIIHFPSGLHPKGTDDRLVSLMDLFSTFLDISHSPFPNPRHSYSLLSSEKRSSASAMILNPVALKLLVAKLVKKSPEWAQTLPSHRYAIILDNGLKLIQREDSSLEIYNLARDPEESQDLSLRLDSQIYHDLLELLFDDQLQTGYQGCIKDFSSKATSELEFPTPEWVITS